MQPRPATERERSAFIEFMKRADVEVVHCADTFAQLHPAKRAAADLLPARVRDQFKVAVYAGPPGAFMSRLAVNFDDPAWLECVSAHIATSISPDFASLEETRANFALGFALFLLGKLDEAEGEVAFLASKAGA